MTMLIKASDGNAQASVHHFERHPHEQDGVSRELTFHPSSNTTPPEDVVPGNPQTNESEEHIRHIESLALEIEKLQGKLRETALKAEAREEDAYRQGKAEGEAVALKHEQGCEQMLAKTLVELQEEFARGFGQFEVLSLQIAQTALSQIFGDKSHYHGMVEQILRHQVTRLKGELVLAIRVSRPDFPDAASLEALTAACPDIDLRSDPTLEPGACVIEFRLGRMEAGVAGQWQRLTKVLEELENEGPIA